jgi:hypothetical protein
MIVPLNLNHKPYIQSIMRTLFLLMFCLTIGTSACAQISIGFNAGVNFSTVKFVPEYSDEPGITRINKYSGYYGLVYGIPVLVHLTDRIGIITGLNYLQKSYRFDSESNFYNQLYIHCTGNDRIEYLELPLQAKFYLTHKKISSYLFAGPSVGYSIGAIGHGESTLINENQEPYIEQVNNRYNPKELHDSGFKPFEMSLSVGAGLGYKTQTGDFFLNVNYLHGITNGMKDIMEYKQYNRGLSLTLGYVMRIKK